MSKPETMTGYEKRQASIAAASLAQAILQLRILDTPQSRELAEELMPFVAKVEKIA